MTTAGARRRPCGSRPGPGRASKSSKTARCRPADFIQTNLVSDLPGLAQVLDPTLKNPWGISLSPNGGAFWVSSNGGGLSELYLARVP